MRVPLPDGHWVELLDRLTWAQRNRVRDTAGGEGDFYGGFITTLCRTFVTGWHVPDDLPLDDSGWERLDADTGDRIMLEALKRWKAQPDPKGTPETPSP